MLIRRLLIVFGILFLKDLALAEPIRVLISIQEEKISEKFSRKMIRRLEKAGFIEDEFKVEQNADQFSLYQALSDPETRALIWISHGSTVRLSWKTKRKLKGSAGMSALPELIDYRGDNVAPAFKTNSPGLNYLAVIGCNSSQILDYVDSDLAEDDRIQKFIPSGKIIAQSAIRKAVRELSRVDWETLKPAPSPTETTELVTIERSIPENAPENEIRALRVMVGNELIGMIPVSKPGEKKIWSFPIDTKNIRQIRLESGQNIMTAPERVQFGEIRITLPDGKVMNVFAKNDGTPFGLNFRLYLAP